MPDYSKSKIYAVKSPNIEKWYLGATTQSLCQRMTGHRIRKSTRSREIIDAGDAYIELIELFPCNNIDELTKRERELILQHKDQLVNITIPLRTRKEYYHDTIERRIELSKKYKEDHKEDIKNYKCKQLEYIREYINKNKDKINEKRRELYEKNKEEINRKQREYRKKKKEQSNDILEE
jgi:hypothetical protein